MKKLLLLITTILFTAISVNASDIDTSIIDKLDESKIEELNVDFKLKTFESCDNLESVMGKYIKDYYKNNKSRYNQPIIYKNFGLEPEIMAMDESDGVTVDSVIETKSVSKQNNSVGGADDFSKTNSQVDGVDESDIIKTDGKYVYYYNDTKKYIYIIDTINNKVLKKIALPKIFNSPVLYIGDNKLVILANGYSNVTYSRNYYINRNSKTYTIVYDITDKSSPILEKLYVNDGRLTKSRKIGKYVYVVSNNSFNIPYHNFKSVDDIVIDNNIIPKKLELSRVSDKNKQNLNIKGKNLPFNIKAGNIAKCSDIEYSLPDEETLKKFSFNPSYNIISIINVEDSSEEVKTKVIAGSNSEIYMSLENLYLTDSIYQSQNYKCPVNARCIMPYYYGGTNNTLVHKMNIVKKTLKYQDSTILPGAPLNQYSMDEKDDHFRIITSTNNWGNNNEKHTDLYILDKNLKLVSSLKNMGKNENFKSSRFIGDKLFLVTFKQVDPLYAIDLADQKNPTILGELKIPGYSEYLHPYDENHLIGLGRDTYDVNGRTRNGGLKIDLYEINYDKKCGDSDLTPDEVEKCNSGDYKGIIVKQKFTKTLGDAGSYSEATRNPRMFMWNANKNLLFLPTTLYTKFNKTDYRNKDFFQGLVTLNIDKNTGITEKYRLTHIDYSKIEEERIKECSKYTVKKVEEQECKKLIDGSTYCPPVRQTYIPPYCYADSTVGEYIANRNYNYRTSFVKRALWIGDNVYSISDEKLVKSDILTGTEKKSVEMK
ncbi:MAG: beta-propeller domain-containing protein [Candidatus Gracilibacteria bacterium]|nr:beta-propeller domain-containing protein [Candidatus Gracilibacteria bacterium]